MEIGGAIGSGALAAAPAAREPVDVDIASDDAAAERHGGGEGQGSTEGRGDDGGDG